MSKPKKLRKRIGEILLLIIAVFVLKVTVLDENKEDPPSPAEAKLLEAQVLAVTDGDTFTVKLPDGNREKVRLLLIDTPETKHPTKPVQPYGPEASAFTTKLLSGKKVQLEFDLSERDQYGRLLAYAYLEGEMVNEMLLEQGYARVAVFQPNVKYVDSFRTLQKKAQLAKRGIWSIEDYVTDRGFNEEAAAASANRTRN